MSGNHQVLLDLICFNNHHFHEFNCFNNKNLQKTTSLNIRRILQKINKTIFLPYKNYLGISSNNNKCSPNSNLGNILNTSTHLIYKFLLKSRQLIFMDIKYKIRLLEKKQQYYDNYNHPSQLNVQYCLLYFVQFVLEHE